MRNIILGLVALGAGMASVGLANAASTPGAPVQTKEQVYASIDGGAVHCYPNFFDSPLGSEIRERQLTLGPKLDLGALMASRNNPPSPEMEAFRKQMADQRVNDWAYRCRYRQDNARIIASGRAPEVVFIGDSITENWPAAHPSFFASGHVGRGVSGQTSSQMVVRFYSDVVALKPRVVHIMAGTNDVGGVTGPTTEDDVVANIKAMVEMASANNIKVVLASVPPIDPSPRKPNFTPDTSVIALNKRLQDLARERGLVYVDYYSVLTDGHGRLREDLANDGLHPNRAGYDLMEPLTRHAIARAAGTAS